MTFVWGGIDRIMPREPLHNVDTICMSPREPGLYGKNVECRTSLHTLAKCPPNFQRIAFCRSRLRTESVETLWSYGFCWSRWLRLIERWMIISCFWLRWSNYTPHSPSRQKSPRSKSVWFAPELLAVNLIKRLSDWSWKVLKLTYPSIF